MNYFFHLLVYFEIYAIVALSLNLLVGYGGLMQMAHAALFGIGAYAAAISWCRLGFGYFAGIALGGISASVLSLMISIPARRFRGDYFILISIAFQTLIYAIIYNWTDMTHGSSGLSGIPHPTIFRNEFETSGSTATLYGLIATLVLITIALVKISPFGRALQAQRDDELAARSIGIPVDRLKTQAFAIAAALVGIAGGLFAGYVGYIDPTSFSLNESILMVSMVIVGGTGNVRGPVVGAFVLIMLPELLRLFQMPDTVSSDVRLLIYGILLIIMMMNRPQGLAGVYRYE